jgi:heat shock protein HtpX
MPSNFARTGLLIIVLTAIFVGMGALVGGLEGMVIAFVIAIGTNAYAFWNSDTVVLRMFKAQEIGPGEAPQLYDIVQRLAQRAELPMPRVYVVPSPQPNAFATGRNPANSAVAVSTGLLDTLSLEELAGVVAHELAHIRNRDTLTMTVAATIAGAISMFANVLQFGYLVGQRRQQGPLGWIGVLAAVLVAPFAAMLVQMAISRSREYEADRIGAWFCGNPLWLASALERIHAAARQTPYPEAEMAPAAAHVFIVNPLTGQGFDSWFTTHPHVENRVHELHTLAAQWQQAESSAPRPIEIAGYGYGETTSTWAGVDDRSGGRGPWS